MSYESALTQAGAKVLAYKEFGSYQGDWLAYVEYQEQKGFVQGSYGSCSVCDAFQSEFDYNSKPEIEDGKFYRDGNTWDEDSECTEEEYNFALKKYEHRLAQFGRKYLEAENRPCLYQVEHYKSRLEQIEKAKAKDKEDWFNEEEKEYIEWAINQTLTNHA